MLTITLEFSGSGNNSMFNPAMSFNMGQEMDGYDESF